MNRPAKNTVACSQGTQTIATVLDLDQRWWNGRNRKLTKEGKSTSSSAHGEQKLLPEKPLLIIEENPQAGKQQDDRVISSRERTRRRPAKVMAITSGNRLLSSRSQWLHATSD